MKDDVVESKSAKIQVPQDILAMVVKQSQALVNLAELCECGFLICIAPEVKCFFALIFWLHLLRKSVKYSKIVGRSTESVF